MIYASISSLWSYEVPSVHCPWRQLRVFKVSIQRPRDSAGVSSVLLSLFHPEDDRVLPWQCRTSYIAICIMLPPQRNVSDLPGWAGGDDSQARAICRPQAPADNSCNTKTRDEANPRTRHARQHNDMSFLFTCRTHLRSSMLAGRDASLSRSPLC
jgi:hypothetical protein